MQYTSLEYSWEKKKKHREFQGRLMSCDHFTPESTSQKLTQKNYNNPSIGDENIYCHFIRLITPSE